jgi:hypothetical protein
MSFPLTKSANKTTYIKTKSPEELGLDIDTKGLYVMTETKWIKAMVADYLTTGNALLQFGVGETTSGTIRDRMGSLSSSKNLLEQKVLIDSEPNPDYSDHDLHPLIRQSFASQVSPNPAKREVFECNIQDYLVKEFIKSNDFVPISEWLSKQVREQQGKLNKDHVRTGLRLRDIQKRVHDKIIKAMRRNGININIIAELAPRLGKTLLFLELAKTAWETPELGHEAMFVLAYGVGLSIKASYKEEISKFSNFAEFVFIDNAEDDAQEEYDNAIANGKFPVVFVSLNAKIGDDEKEERLDWIGTRTEKAIALLEETDFGVHTDSQVEKTQKMFANMEVTQINSSGTNIGRIAKASGDKDVDEIIRVPYCMVEQMRNAEALGIVKRKFYNMTFNPAMNKLLEEYDEDLLPNITKILADANTQEKFISELFKDILSYKIKYKLNLNRQADEIIKDLMLFVTITKKQMRDLAEVIEDACENHKVLILNGDEPGMSNKEAQSKTVEELVKLKNGKYPGRDKLIVMTNMMGTRSYSVPEIQACLFMMEGGGIYAFMQRYSRCLTPGGGKKFGHIFDFSFDQNKTRNTEMAIAIEAAAVMEQKDISFPDAVREVMFSVSLKDNLDGEWTANDVIDRFEDNDKLVEVANALSRVDVEDFADDDFPFLAELAKRAMSKAETSNFKKIIKTGKTYETKKRNGEDTTSAEDKAYKNSLKDAKLIIERAIRALNSSASTVAEFTNYEGKTYEQCLDIIAKSDKLSVEFHEMFGVPIEFVIKSKDKLPCATLDLIVERTNRGHSEHNIANSSLGIIKDNPKLWRRKLSSRAIRRKITSKKCKSILIMAGGEGTEIDVLVELYGIDILAKIVYNDKYTSFCNRIKRKYPQITVMQGDFLTLEFDMKFDLVLGNPPYLRETWKKFMERAVTLSDRVIMISPDGVTSVIETEKRKKFKNFLIDNGIQSMEDCTADYPHVETGLIKIYDMDRTKDANSSLFAEDTSIDAIICRKVIEYASRPDVSTLDVSRRSGNTIGEGPEHQLLRNLGAKNGCTFETVNTNDATINADEHYFINRFFGQKPESPVFELSGQIVPSPNIFYIKRPENMTISEFKELYNNPVFIYYINIARGLGFDTTLRTMKTLPILEAGKNPMDIYGFSSEEKEHIKSNTVIIPTPHVTNSTLVN